MQRRDVLKSIGAAGVSTGAFSNVAIAENSATDEWDLSDEEVQQYLKSEEVDQVLERFRFGLGPEGGPRGRSKNRLRVNGEAKMTHILVDDETPVVQAARLQTNFGILALVLDGGEVLQAMFAPQIGAVGTRRLRRATSIDYVEGKEWLLVADSDTSFLARHATDGEKAKLGQHVSGEIKHAAVVDDADGGIFLKVRTADAIETIDVDRNTTIATGSVGGVSAQSANCSFGDYASCAFDIVTTVPTCGLAGLACSITGVGGPGPIVACLYALWSLCGTRVILAHLSGSCYEVAYCIDDWCQDNPGACGPITPLPPV